MASPDPEASSRAIERGLTCSICLDPLREPKDLDCPHVFCLECLQTWVKKEPTIECPECRKITVVPQGGLSNLKTNLRLKNMIEEYDKSKNTERDENQTAAPICPDHERQEQKFLSVTCGVTACHNFLVQKHPHHEINILLETKKPEEEKNNTQQMKTEEDRGHKKGRRKKKTKDRRRKRREFEDGERKLESAKQQAERAVEARAQQMISEVVAKKTEMIRCIQTTYQQRMQIIQKEKQIQLTEDRIRIERSCNAQDDKPPEDLTMLQFNPGSGSLSSLWFGELVTSTRTECKLTLVTEFGRFQQSVDVAVSHVGLLTIVDHMGKDVSVYRDESGEYERQFGLKTTRPDSVSVTSEDQFLVSDHGVVKVFSPDGAYERSWDGSVSAGRITRTPDDMIVIGSFSQEVITVHQSNGELIRRHKVKDCKKMQDLASNGKQIAFTTGDEGKVYVIDFVTGHKLWVVDMVWPLGICYEQKSDTLLVAGGSQVAGQCVIQQYSSTTGHLISCLASGLCTPLGMTVTYDSKLVVADNKTVKIYTIQ